MTAARSGRTLVAGLAMAALASGCARTGHQASATTTSSAPVAPTTATTVAPTTTTTAPPDAEPPDAVAAGQQVAAAETAIRGGDRDPAWGIRQQVAYRVLVVHPEWMPEALAQVPASLRPVAQANVDAGSQLRRLTKPKTALPAWRIVAPAPADELLADYKGAEAEIGVPWPYLAAINLVETRMGRIRGNSDAGAQGPMQFLPATFAQYGNGGDIQSPHDAIYAAARLLKRNGAPGDMRNAIYNYNHDQRYVDAVTAYAGRMAADVRAYYGYHQWQVYYVTTAGDVWLPEGYVGPKAAG
jgi:membrane-bound lytic murein transglycosylase B